MRLSWSKSQKLRSMLTGKFYPHRWLLLVVKRVCNMSNTEIKSRLLKLLALAERGVGGEKKNAQRFLDRELKKHGLTIADLDDSESSLIECAFVFKNKNERQLLVQVLCMVMKSDRIFLRTPKGSKKILIKLTPFQKFEVDMFYSVYKRDLAKTLDNAFIAFISKNNIFSGIAKEASSEISKKDAFEIAQMMQGIQKTEVHLAISHCNSGN